MKKRNTKRELYIAICNEVDEILEQVGIKKICRRCSTIKPYRFKERWFIKKIDLGCCNGCEYLSKNGCKVKAIACKLWLCSDKLKNIMDKKGVLKRFEALNEVAVMYNWTRGRKGIKDYFDGK